MTAMSTTGSQSVDLHKRALREALRVGAISLGLFVLFIGLKTEQNTRNELILTTRWGLLAIVVALVMAGRFLMIAYLTPAITRAKASKARTSVAIALPSTLTRNRNLAGIAFMAVYPIVMFSLFGPHGSLKYIDSFGVQILIYIMLAWGLNIVVGLAGLLDLGYVAFYAVGAYSYALLGTQFGWSFWILLPLAGILAAFWGVILGFPVLRLRGDYLAIVTLAFGEIIRLVLINWSEVTNGPAGISSIPKIGFFGLFSFDPYAPDYIVKVYGLVQSSVYYKIFLYYLILCLALLVAYVTVRLRRMPVGRAWEALREDEIACRSLGINTTNTKLTAFAIGAMFGGFAGAFFAARQGFISPESFRFEDSATILAIVVLGGMGSLPGIAIAAAATIGAFEALRELTFLKAVFGADFDPELYRMLIFGLAMVVVIIWRPRGFVATREPTAFLHERKAVAASFTKEGHG